MKNPISALRGLCESGYRVWTQTNTSSQRGSERDNIN